MPTLLELLEVPSPVVDGVSLVDVMTGRRGGLNLAAYSESLYPARFGWSPLHALREGRFKLIVAPRPELYDLVEDSVERTNLYTERRALADEMMTRATLMAARRPPRAREGTVTPDVRARVASLGYVATGDLNRPTDGPLLDPKDCIGTYASLRRHGRAEGACMPGRTMVTPSSSPLPEP